MAVEKFLSTQASILIAGAAIAAGLFFGVRGREGPALPAPSASTAAVAPTAAPAASAGPDRAAAMAAVAKALDRHRAEVVATCVRPALARKPDPPRITLTLNMTFGPDGRPITRGLAEDRETAREGVSTCVMDTLPAFEIPAQGTSVYLDVPWLLP